MTIDEQERAMALTHAPAGVRPALASLFALDAALGQVLRTTSELMIGQLRLAWWRDALTRLDDAPPPAEPVLVAIAAEVLQRGVSGTALAMITDGWEALLAETLDEPALAAFAAKRGGGLFRAAATVLCAQSETIEPAGEGWALADLAGHVDDAAVSARARVMASARFAAAFAHPWPPAARPLGAQALLARADLAGIAPGSPRRVLRLIGHRLTGR